jgi:hypothetical protein
MDSFFVQIKVEEMGLENVNVKDHLRNRGLVGRPILKLILEKYNV